MNSHPTGIRRLLSAAIASFAAVVLVSCAPSGAPEPTSASPTSTVPATSTPAPVDPARFTALEERFDVVVGVYAIDTGSGRTVEYRPDDRFGFASTIKAIAAGLVFSTTTDEQLDAPIAVTSDDLVPYSPVIEQRVGGTVSLLEAADAAVRFSDNAAANLLFRHLGGPEAMETMLRDVGDTTTNADRIEPELNDVSPGDDRDTSTPRAMATTLADLALGDALDVDDEARLIDLLQRNTTGDALIRAAAPEGWTIGDKTGSAAFGTRNDIAIAWPPGDREPIVIAILTRGHDVDAEPIDEVLAEAAALVFDSLSSR
ncbi:class A beta-lactamase [Microbacterium sp. SA39]|uniref:class A beta-lactamase n=1 Tax=Microbacterium sp. SA39 TaxID=1263625 RepID=UPI0005F9E411|nr:class A beta-lactamase [Microbacterium sp. SA39]